MRSVEKKGHPLWGQDNIYSDSHGENKKFNHPPIKELLGNSLSLGNFSSRS